MTVTEIRQILESPYDRSIWKNFLQTQFTNNKLNAEDRKISLSDNPISKECLSLGFYEIDDYTKIGIFEIELSPKVNLARNRVQLRNLLKDITKQMAGAMVVFVQGEQWRFSYISKRKFHNKDTNTIEDKETAPKRYTYLFGKGEKALTAAQNFYKLIQKQKGNLYDLLSLEDFEDAFSVEKLGKEFFKNYKEIYEDFVEYITGYRYVKKGSKWTKTQVHEPHFDFLDIFKGDSKAVRDFFKRMMGRIVFLYFIQKKGWMAVPKNENWDKGNPDYLYQLFKNAQYKELFYSDYLVPLFFDTLNNPDSENEKKDLRFPYLNGGLFDKSQDFLYDKLALPSAIFDKLFDTFNRYNFTIYEDAPDEHTVAVDPEMLGHIFENLLEDNKDKGAFYTPKEIVHYMCKESLKAYLSAKEDLDAAENSIAQSALENIILQQELSKDELKYADKYAYKIIDALDHVKICDPAIGSGAFPMGLLQEIFNAQVYLQELKGFTKAKSDAEIKKHIIEESIYGVDIDEGAVDIARLRFWLSLVVDEPKPQPLPNLSFKIVCANTLIPLGKPKGDLGLTNEIADQIEAIREEYFTANKDAKKHLEMQFRNLQNKLWTTAKEWATAADVEIYKKISEFNPFADKSCSWFDPWWMFGVKDGFDIVIGNPPYDVYEGSKKDEIQILNKIELYEKAKGGKLNAYKLFIAKSFDLLNYKGIFCQIFQNSFLADNSAKKIRKFIIEDSKIIKIDSYPERDDVNKRVFESAKMSVCILLCKKQKSTCNDFDLNVWESKNKLKFSVKINRDSIIRFDDKNFVIPTITSEEMKIYSQVKKSVSSTFNDFSKCIEGELNMTFHKQYFTNNSDLPLIVKGAQVQRYYVTQKPSQGEVQYLDVDSYLIDYGKTEKSNHHKDKRIALQGITGANDKIRLVMSILEENIFCANSCNYIIVKNDFKDNLDIHYLLSIANSKIINWIFRKSSTNSNVNCYEIDSLPLKIIPLDKQYSFAVLTKYLNFLYLNLDNILSHTENSRIASHIEDILNMMVYELYFEEHMKEVDLDVLQFVTPIIENLQNLPIEQQIKELYEWYQKPENAVRQRMMLIDTRSPDILAVIHKSM